MNKVQLLDHLFNLKEVRQQYFDAGLWDKVDYVQLCIDDTVATIAALD